jgi:Fe-S cluster assembly protein SufD
MTRLAQNIKTPMIDLSRPAHGGRDWLTGLRSEAAAVFEASGFPTTRQEEWRFTNVAPIAQARFVPADPFAAVDLPGLVSRFTLAEDCSAELVFVNGIYRAEFSRVSALPRGVFAGPMSAAAGEVKEKLPRHLGRHANIHENPFVALNTANLADAAVVHVPANLTVQRPIHLLMLSSEADEHTICHPRIVVLVERSAELPLIETYGGGGAGCLTNVVVEIVVAEDARVDHCRVQQESRGTWHVGTVRTDLAARASYVCHGLTLGGKLTRNDLQCGMNGKGAYATLNGLVVIEGDQHCDNHTLLDHAQSDCPSHELYKYVLGGRASGVFKGKILVRPDAQKTDSKQTSKTLLLSDDAVMNSMPALEIYADDVKCTHGSTTGPVEEDMVFYLRSRGVGLDAARHLLTYAFAADITRRIRMEPVRRRVEDLLAAQHGLPLDLRINDLGQFDDAVL